MRCGSRCSAGAFSHDPGRFHQGKHGGAHLVVADEGETIDAIPDDPGWILERNPGSQPFRERVDGPVLVQRAIPPGIRYDRGALRLNAIDLEWTD